jgi:hypothetical protein
MNWNDVVVFFGGIFIIKAFFGNTLMTGMKENLSK